MENLDLTMLTRSQQFDKLIGERSAEKWDIIIVGGGITGAGTLLMACKAGLKALLVEQQDFAWGASSNSSKMVHGGLRYLGSGQYGLTKDAVTERQRLLEELPGLVDPLQFLMGHYKEQFPGPFIFNSLLAIYDWIGGKKNHQYVAKGISDFYAPGIAKQGLQGATQFADAVTDDARLVMRILQEARELGGTAINYLKAEALLYSNERISGIKLTDNLTGDEFQLNAKVIVNAAGPWTDELREQFGAKKVIRPLRGSHLIVPAWRLPMAYSVSYFHPQDKRPIFAFPWENATVIGTTDLDHSTSLSQQPCISQVEIDYLLLGINQQFPHANITTDDVISSYAGIRPVVSKNPNNPNSKPSDEKREHSIWDDNGLISVAGGKLTTFRLIALDILQTAKPYLPKLQRNKLQGHLFNPPQAGFELSNEVNVNYLDNTLTQQQILRLQSCYGRQYHSMIKNSSRKMLQPIANTRTSFAELSWSLQHESVEHLDDLMLRRSRLGLLLANGGAEYFPQIKPLCMQQLGWSESKWQQEVARYQDIILQYFSLPERAKQITQQDCKDVDLSAVGEN